MTSNLKRSGSSRQNARFNIEAGFHKNSAQQLANNIRTFPLRFSGIRGDG